jgi:16S rRNA (guanine527-N7)-methyltransferase
VDSTLIEFGRALKEALARWDWPITREQLDTLGRHYLAVVETNRKFNLTRITDPREAAVKHYADSLALLLWCRAGGVMPRSVLDVGTGAGFPSVPLAVMRPDWHVTALEATRKKAHFLIEAGSAMGLQNLSVVHGHSSHWKSARVFDVVVFRALRRLDRALTENARFCGSGGWIVAYKTAALPTKEIEATHRVAARLGLKSSATFEYDLVCGEEILWRALSPFRRLATRIQNPR